MTKYLDIYSDLIKLAAQMAKGEGVPDWSERVFSTGTPSYERRDMLSALRMADEAGITHALQLRAIADRLSAEIRSSNEPCEQRGPFAGLQSLSFDVSENPTIALVMRFDNIEHAQAARDQLWQPAGAARDASSGERWPKSIAGEAPWCKCPDGDCAGWDEAINHGCCCRVANGR